MHRAQGGEDHVLEGAVLLHGGLELVEGDFAVAVGVHLVEYLVQLPWLRDVPREAVLGQRLGQQQIQLSLALSAFSNLKKKCAC